MAHYIIYARKSIETDDKQMQSIDDQLAFCRKRIHLEKNDVVSEFTEEKSAKKPYLRKEFTQVMELIEKSKYLLFWWYGKLTDFHEIL